MLKLKFLDKQVEDIEEAQKEEEAPIVKAEKFAVHGEEYENYAAKLYALWSVLSKLPGGTPEIPATATTALIPAVPATSQNQTLFDKFDVKFREINDKIKLFISVDPANFNIFLTPDKSDHKMITLGFDIKLFPENNNNNRSSINSRASTVIR